MPVTIITGENGSGKSIHGKCFYCEGEGKMTVDHYIEVAERGDLAFAWINLYLACEGCQAKVPNTSIPVTDCVDPCDPATNPADHLKFEDEYITFLTPRGEQTIKKYRLKRDPLVSERRRMLQRFNADLIELVMPAGAAEREPRGSSTPLSRTARRTARSP